MRPLTEIILHCSDTRPDWMLGKPVKDKVDEIRRWHVQDRGWKDIGYHYVIDRNGAIAEGRPLDQIGAHVMGHNVGTIGVCLLGGYDSSADDTYEQNFTKEQKTSVKTLINKLKTTYPTIKLITGHNNYASKACPGFRVNANFLETLK